MKIVLTVLGILLVVGGLAYHFAALEIFNAVVPKDEGSALVVAEVSYGSEDRQRLDIYGPTQGQGPWPVVVFVHGGSWQTGNKDGYEFAGRALAAQGFLVLVVNYRLHPKPPYPAFIDDTALALRWARDNAAQYKGDGGQLFAVGHSAGAYNIAMAVLDKRHADVVPPMAGVVTLAGPFDFLPLDSPVTKEVFGSLPDLEATQPVNHVSKDAPPFLILHGRVDKTVLIKNALSLQRAFDQVGAQATTKIYEDVSHVGIMLAISKPMRSNAPVLQDAVQFIKSRMK